MKQYAVIVAGGSGSRMGGGIPKQFLSLCGRPVLWWSIKAFHEENPATEIIVVLPKDFITLWNDFFSTLPEEERFDHRVTEGGKSRSQSVKNGLSLIEEDDSLVAVHDGARPLVSRRIISDGWLKAKEFGSAIPVVKVVDSLRHVCGNENNPVNRDEYVKVQTPQVFHSALLKKSYEGVDEQIFTDDATVVEESGVKVTLFVGDERNIKITTPKDMTVASVLMDKDG